MVVRMLSNNVTEKINYLSKDKLNRDIELLEATRNNLDLNFFTILQRVVGKFEKERECKKVSDREIYHYMIYFFNNNDELPTVDATAKHFGLAGNAINQRFLRFERNGWLVRNSLNNLMFPRFKSVA